VDYEGLDSGAPFVVRKYRELRLPPEDLFHGIASVLDYLRRQRVLFDEVHKTFSKFWNDGDSEMQNGYLPEMDPPKGTKLTRAAADNESYVVQCQGASGDIYIRKAGRKWGVADADLSTFLKDLFEFLVGIKLLKPVTLEGAKVMKRVQRRLLWAKNTITKLNQKQESAGTLDSVDEATCRRCERYIKRLKGEMKKGKHEVEGQYDSIAYSVLAVEGFLPGYGLERGTILGSAEIPFWEAGQTKDFALPRPPLLALREYVPGNLIYANGHRFVTRRYQFEPGENRNEIALEVSVSNNAMREAGVGSTSNAGTQILLSLPLTDAELIHVSQISDEEDYRFQMRVATLGHEKHRHSGGRVFTYSPTDLSRKSSHFEFLG